MAAPSIIPSEIRRLAQCPACRRLCREPWALEPCRHSVCRACLQSTSNIDADNAATSIPRCCPVCRTVCTDWAPHRSLAVLTNLVRRRDQAWLSRLLRRLRATATVDASGSSSRRRVSGAPLRPSAVLHFPKPPFSLQTWPLPFPSSSSSSSSAASRDLVSDPGVAAILRDANNQRLWAAPATDGAQARPVMTPEVGDADGGYTISGFCLARPEGRGAGGGSDWLAVISDFYRNRLLVCDLGNGGSTGQCLQRLLNIPRPTALAADGHDGDGDGDGNSDSEGDNYVFALTANGTELRAFRWHRRRRLVRHIFNGKSEGVGDGEGDDGDNGVVFRHSRLRYGRAVAVGAGRVCIADSGAAFVFVLDRRRLLAGGYANGEGAAGFACDDTPPLAIAVAGSDTDVTGGVAFVNAVGANRRRCLAVHDLASGRRLAELACGFVCVCGCPGCADAADIGAVHFDAVRRRLLVARRARACHLLVFHLQDGDSDGDGDGDSDGDSDDGDDDGDINCDKEDNADDTVLGRS